MNYTTLIFDAFDTVIHINTSKLPVLHIDGQTVPTTAQAVHSAYMELFGKINFDVFYHAFSQSFMQVSARRRADLKEVLSQERFRVMLDILGHPATDATDMVLEKITRAHMWQL